MLSNEAEYNSLPLGNEKPTFANFAFATENDINKLIAELNLNFTETANVRSVWSRHPSRGKIF
jgi:hypothetical protein